MSLTSILKFISGLKEGNGASCKNHFLMLEEQRRQTSLMRQSRLMEHKEIQMRVKMSESWV